MLFMYFYQVALYTTTFSPSPPTQNGASSPPAPFRPATIFCSHVEAEIDHVAVLDHIVLALGPQQTLFLGGVHASAVFQEALDFEPGGKENPLQCPGLYGLARAGQ